MGLALSQSHHVLYHRRLIDIARQRGIELQLVISPILPVFARQKGYRAWRDEIVTVVGDIRLWDYGNRPPLVAKYFKDPVHFNASGVDVFMDLLRRDGFFDRKERRSTAGRPAVEYHQLSNIK